MAHGVLMLFILFWLLVGHALCDYPLQGDWLSRAKNPALSLVPGESIWIGALSCHAMIHAGAVALVTQSLFLGALEFVAHFVIDLAKCGGRLSYNADQTLHVLCKLAWCALLIAGLQ